MNFYDNPYELSFCQSFCTVSRS